MVSATNQLDNTTKLDVDHRNSYNNRMINRFQRSPQIVVDDNEYLQSSDSYYSSSVDVSATTSAYTSTGTNAHKPAGYIGYRGSLSAGTSLDEPNAHGSGSGGGGGGGGSGGGGGGGSGSIDGSNRRYVDRRKKTVRFDGQESNDWTRWDSERQNSQDSTTRDSGIDTSSTFTSSEDSNRGEVYNKVLHQQSNLTYCMRALHYFFSVLVRAENVFVFCNFIFVPTVL